tara:strand:+ start:777 stop:1520 length:744 start_codon:yes stop_codon:yes gene_type:complete
MAATPVNAAANYLSPITESVAKGNATDLEGLLKLGDAVGGLGGGLGSLIRSFGGDSSSSGMDLGDPFDPKYADLATAKVNTEYGKLLQQLGGIANDIAYLTGNTVPDAVQEFRNRYIAYIEPAAQRGYNQLFGFDPNAIGPSSLEDYGDKATNKLSDTMNRFSSINRQNFMDLASNPETVEIDPNIYQKQFNKYMDESNKKLMDYSGEQTQDLISGAGSPGSRYSRERMAGFFADSPEVARLMDFSA